LRSIEVLGNNFLPGVSFPTTNSIKEGGGERATKTRKGPNEILEKTSRGTLLCKYYSLLFFYFFLLLSLSLFIFLLNIAWQLKSAMSKKTIPTLRDTRFPPTSLLCYTGSFHLLLSLSKKNNQLPSKNLHT